MTAIISRRLITGSVTNRVTQLVTRLIMGFCKHSLPDIQSSLKIPIKRYIRAVLLTLPVALASAGCASVNKDEQSNIMLMQPKNSLGNVEYHTAILADELFANFRGQRNLGQYRFAVAGFVPVATMQFDDNTRHPLKLLGHQLEQGLMTEASRRGLITQDYKVTDSIMVSATSDKVMSRNTDKLSKAPLDVDFFISGTITEQQQGAIVNARVVHVETKDVVAAATKFFPADLFWSQEQVTTRDGMIYRHSLNSATNATEDE